MALDLTVADTPPVGVTPQGFGRSPANCGREIEVTVTTLPLGDEHHVIALEVEGELTLDTFGRVEEQAQEAVGSAQPLIMDLSSCPFVDSMGLRLVVRLHKALSAAGARMAVIIAHPDVWRVFSLTSIDRKVPVFPRPRRGGGMAIGSAVGWVINP